MKAVGYRKSLPINNPDALQDIELPTPTATGRDLLIKVNAIAVNPVDYKIRQRVSPCDDPTFGENPKVLGWDAVGEVVAIGNAVNTFKLGDKVYYAGDLNRQGSNAEYQLVDERIVGHKPKNLSDAEAVALPLTAITAWEMLFEHLAIEQQTENKSEKSNAVILVVGAAGGVGSIFIQLAKALTGATIIATASRESSQAWVKNLGADYVVDHTQPLQPQINGLIENTVLIENKAIGQITHVASLNNTPSYFDDYTELLVPFGKIAIIDDPGNLDVMKMKPKSLSLHIEFMFARSMFNAADIEEQGKLLNRVSALVDQGHIKTTMGKNLGIINAENLRLAHTELEAGTAIGKIVMEGF